MASWSRGGSRLKIVELPTLARSACTAIQWTLNRSARAPDCWVRLSAVAAYRRPAPKSAPVPASHDVGRREPCGLTRRVVRHLRSRSGPSTAASEFPPTVRLDHERLGRAIALAMYSLARGRAGPRGRSRSRGAICRSRGRRSVKRCSSFGLPSSSTRLQQSPSDDVARTASSQFYEDKMTSRV